jgi:PAS domain S-box-containing protein
LSWTQPQKLWERFAGAPAEWLRGPPTTSAEEPGNEIGLLRAVLQSSPNVVFVKDRRERLITANPAYFDLFGKTPEQVLGFDVSAFVPDPETVRFIRKLEQEVISSGTPRRLEWSWGPGGAKRIYIAAIVPLWGHKGSIQGPVGVLTDITEQKWNARRNELLSMAATRLLESENPQDIVEELCRAAMDFLDCQAFLNYSSTNARGGCASTPALVSPRTRRTGSHGSTWVKPSADAPQRIASVSSPRTLLKPMTPGPIWSSPMGSRPIAAIRSWSREG